MQDVDIDSLILTPPEFDDYDCEPLIKATKATNCSQMIRELMAYRMLQGNHGRMLRSAMGIDVSKTRLKSATQHLVFAIKLLFENEIILENRGFRNTNALRLIDGWCRYDDLGFARTERTFGSISANSSTTRRTRLFLRPRVSSMAFCPSLPTGKANALMELE